MSIILLIKSLYMCLLVSLILIDGRNAKLLETDYITVEKVAKTVLLSEIILSIK